MTYTILEGTDQRTNDPWIRLPHPKGRCQHTGLARTTLLELVFRSKGQIKTVSLKKPGAIRGVRLIHLPSLQTYLAGLADQQALSGREAV